MNVQTQIRAAEPVTTEHFDVLIAGAGISGVGAAYHLTTQCPGTSFVVLETQKTFGGTWSTHRYPGIRSDSDLHTFGYRFKPWTSAPIASAAEILKYMGEVIEENDLSSHIRYRQHHHRGEVVERDQSLDHRCNAYRHRRAAALHHQLLLDVPGLLPPRRGLYARMGRHGQVQGHGRASADLAR
ncbi:cation diffusion facilitator CzcD-associated flavoprotein CzcO [Bradyrhizobium sp. JR6.1]